MSPRTAARAATYETPTDNQIVITRVVDAPKKTVFEAWTNPKYVPHWLLGPEGWTMPVCEIDLRVGGSWHYVWRKTDGQTMDMRGSYREVVPPDRLVSTESWGPEWPETINTLDLTESGGQTTIRMTVTYPNRDARDAAMRTGMKEGMDMGFARLDEVLATIA